MEIVRSKKNLDELLAVEEGNAPVYIINTSNERSVAILNLVTPGTGKVVPHHIHSTWIPQNLFPDRPRDILLNCIDLRQYITKGLITLVDTKWAEKILEGSDALYEMDRLNVSQQSIFSGAAGQKLSRTDAYSGQNVKLPADFKKSVQDMKDMEEEEETEPDVNDRIKDLISRFESNDIEIRSLMSELQNIGPLLNDKDYAWLIGSTSNTQIRNFAKESMSIAGAVTGES